jgi:D-beta-D-heptose 7-phosphate kinase/D-beta-D-heptose 1-phosphate adenosyltransferase
VRKPEEKVLGREAMRGVCEKLRAEGKRIAFTNGCFDILHIGHVEYLTFAREQADVLVVGLNSDSSIRHIKGHNRPIVPERDRALVLASLEIVDYVVVFGEKEPKDLIGELLPDVLIKGRDWAHYVSGREVVEAHGGQVVLADLVEGHSTTNIIRRILELGRMEAPLIDAPSPRPSPPGEEGGEEAPDED